jgi:hypothetical protein
MRCATWPLWRIVIQEWQGGVDGTLLAALPKMMEASLHKREDRHRDDEVAAKSSVGHGIRDTGGIEGIELREFTEHDLAAGVLRDQIVLIGKSCPGENHPCPSDPRRGSADDAPRQTGQVPGWFHGALLPTASCGSPRT